MRIFQNRIALLATLLLTFFLTGAFAADYGVSGMFTITYDDSVFKLDDTSYQSKSTDTYRWLFLLTSTDYLVEVSTEQLERSLNLATATAEERQVYLDDMLSSFDEDSATYLEMVDANGTPFYVYQLEDAEGPYLLAETVVSGHAIDFYAYYDDAARSADEALMTVLTELLSTFAPAA